MRKLLMILAFLMLYFNVYSQSEKYTAIDILNVRNGPGTQFEIIHKLMKGEEVEVIKKNDSGWHQIRYSNITGYVSGKYLKPDSEVTI